MKTKRLAPLLLCFVLLAVGCGPKTPIQRHPPNPVTGDPGTKTTLDADGYDALVATNDVIDQVKKDLDANAFPAAQVDTVKKVLNVTIDAYTFAKPLWQAYHASQTPENAAALQDALGKMQTAKVSLANVKKGT